MEFNYCCQCFGCSHHNIKCWNWRACVCVFGFSAMLELMSVTVFLNGAILNVAYFNVLLKLKAASMASSSRGVECITRNLWCQTDINPVGIVECIISHFQCVLEHFYPCRFIVEFIEACWLCFNLCCSWILCLHIMLCMFWIFSVEGQTFFQKQTITELLEPSDNKYQTFSWLSRLKFGPKSGTVLHQIWYRQIPKKLWHGHNKILWVCSILRESVG